MCLFNLHEVLIPSFMAVTLVLSFWTILVISVRQAGCLPLQLFTKDQLNILLLVVPNFFSGIWDQLTQLEIFLKCYLFVVGFFPKIKFHKEHNFIYMDKFTKYCLSNRIVNQCADIKPDSIKDFLYKLYNLINNRLFSE